MQITVSSSIKIENATKELFDYCAERLWIKNPRYYTKRRMGLWTGKTPERLYLYERDGNTLYVPIGVFGLIKPMIPKQVLKNAIIALADDKRVNFGDIDFNLYDYQKTAVENMLKAHYGILQSRAGSGKTQMGLALATALGYKTLWLTHTQDLLDQSYERAKMYIDESRLGKITSGRVELGDITFATVQTMQKLDLSNYRYKFNTVIVDECHRACSSTFKTGQLAKILNSLAARHKYGLTDTVCRSIVAYIGDVRYHVPDTAVKAQANKEVKKIKIERFNTGVTMDELEDFTDFDGTLIWCRYVSALADCHRRNLVLSNKISNLLDDGRTVLVLSDRIHLLEELNKIIGGEVLTGSVNYEDRKNVVDNVKNGGSKLLLSTFSLAKDYLTNISNLDTLVLATPVRDCNMLIGILDRIYENKNKPLVVDVVDDDGKSEELYKKRCRQYKKEGYLQG